jgi:putative nucleotidyltransferase with HDIG domain
MRKEEVLRVLPEIELIKDSDLKEKTIAIWQKAVTDGQWERIENIPFYPKIPAKKVNLVMHVRAVTYSSLKAAENMKITYGYEINLDFVTAGAILHDVCKALEFSPQGGESSIGNLTTHGASGVHLCMQMGMPVEITHIVASHTKRMGLHPKTIEGIIVHYSDHCDAQAIALTNGLPFF